ncbi:MAG: CCA tRNA nucleotidyltransferase [Xanthobacteraceae bacterium]
MSGVPQLADAAWLREGEVARLLSLLDRDGEEARVVGGAVRNALLRVPIGEIDVATTALPDEVTRRVEAAGGKALATGIEHGTVTAIIGDRPIEVTTLRQDVETFGRKARVVFGRDWRADAERRDFTINALSITPVGVFHDYVGGLDDIAARRVRFIGEPRRRIEEDYLRILRFFRFHANFAEGAPDSAGLHACVAARAGLETLSRERVRAELVKLLLAPHATATLAIMSECGLLGMILGGVALLASFENLVKAEAALGAEPDAVRRLGALGVWVKEDADRLTSRLRLSGAEAERLLALEHWWRVAPDSDAQPAHALLYELGPQRFLDRVLVAWTRSDEGAADINWRQLATLPQRWTVPGFPLKAADFVQRGVQAGPRLGNALRAAETAWIAADFPAERLILNGIADEAAREVLAG